MSRPDSVQLPNFLVMGVPKSGTTSLYNYLRYHPQIYLPPRKELHYFTSDLIKQQVAGPGDDRVAANLCHSLEEYQNFYHEHTDQPCVGDVSPSYFYFTECYQRIKQTLGPQVKLVVVLRNPIDRAFSNYQHLVNAGRETLDFYQALLEEPQRMAQGYGDFWRYVDHSLYLDKLDQLYSQFSPEQIHLVSFKDLQQAPDRVMKDLYNFLQVDATYVAANQHVVYGKGGKKDQKWWMSLFTKSASWKRWVKKILPSSALNRYRQKRDELISNTSTTQLALDEQAYQWLQEKFAKDQEIIAATLSDRIRRKSLPSTCSCFLKKYS